jgi:hypothetical protein
MKKDKVEYVSKRLVARGSKRAFKKAAGKAMEENGYVVVAKDGWVVKEFSDGTIERLHQLDTAVVNTEVLLD